MGDVVWIVWVCVVFGEFVLCVVWGCGIDEVLGGVGFVCVGLVVDGVYYVGVGVWLIGVWVCVGVWCFEDYIRVLCVGGGVVVWVWCCWFESGCNWENVVDEWWFCEFVVGIVF